MTRIRKIFGLLTVLALVLGTMAQPVFADPGSEPDIAAASDMMPGCDECPPGGDVVQMVCHGCAHFPADAVRIKAPGSVTVRLQASARTALGRAPLPDPHPPRIAIA